MSPNSIVRCGMVCTVQAGYLYSMVSNKPQEARIGMIWYGMERLVWYGKVGMVWYGMAWHGVV